MTNVTIKKKKISAITLLQLLIDLSITYPTNDPNLNWVHMLQGLIRGEEYFWDDYIDMLSSELEEYISERYYMSNIGDITWCDDVIDLFRNHIRVRESYIKDLAQMMLTERLGDAEEPEFVE